MEVSKRGNASKVDMISNLPDHILDLILSRLQGTEEVIRTSILSRRWKYLWTSVHSIDIDCSRGQKPLNEFQKDKFEAFVSRVLAGSSLDLDSFRLFCGNHYSMSTVEGWIDTAVRRKVKLLDLIFCVDDGNEDCIGDIELPHCLLNCGSLEVLKLSLFACRLSFPKSTGFPALKVLQLKNCYLLNDDLSKDFFRSCPLLEDLSLVGCKTYYLDSFCISCPNLKTLRIDHRKTPDGDWYDELLERMCLSLQICCSNLVFLEFAGFMAEEFICEILNSLKKAVVHPQDTFLWANENFCELFSGISHVESLSLCICLIIKSNYLEDFPESLPNLKTLELITTNDAFNINLLIQILNCSMNLESLLLIIQKDSLETSLLAEDYDLEFLEMNLVYIFERVKKVKMTGVSALPHHMRFIELLLRSSPVLETMSITPSVNMNDGKSSFLTDVFKFQRASTKAEIIFLKNQL